MALPEPVERMIAEHATAAERAELHAAAVDLINELAAVFTKWPIATWDELTTTSTGIVTTTGLAAVAQARRAMVEFDATLGPIAESSRRRQQDTEEPPA